MCRRFDSDGVHVRQEHNEQEHNDNERTLKMERKVYLDGKVYVCRGNNIVRIR